MVAKMRSTESKVSSSHDAQQKSDIDLPVFEEPLREHWPLKMSWSEAIRQFASSREHYMRNFDSPEKRLRDKNPEPFRVL
jgi:hypothetical protein